MEDKHIYVYTVHVSIIYISLHDLEVWITVIFQAIKITLLNPFLCLLYLLAMLPWFFILKYLLMRFFLIIIFHALVYFSFLLHKHTASKHNSKSHSFSQVNTLSLNLTCYKEFLNFLFTKILNNYLWTQCTSMCPLCNSR